jgi:hypothetical protein
MVHRSIRLRIAAVLTGVTLAALAVPAARAFTVEDGAGKDPLKFDLEEQMRQFRNGGTAGAGKSQWDTPVGQLHFGTQSNSMFGSGLGPNSGVTDRRHFDRMFAPDFMKDRY